MNSNDGFDKFLKEKFQDTMTETEDNGFTEKVLAGLPARKGFPYTKQLIQYGIAFASILIFLVSGGFKFLIQSLISVFNNGFHLTAPSLSSVFVLLVFISIPFIIARIGYDESVI